MVEPILSVTDTSDPQVRELISGGLFRFNVEQTGIDDRRALTVVALDPETKQVLGGLTGRTSFGVLFIELFFLPENLRGGGVGGRILRLTEEEARRRGCCAAMLLTFSFQAPSFYERHGYEILGQFDCHPPGTSRIVMTKTLD